MNKFNFTSNCHFDPNLSGEKSYFLIVIDFSAWLSGRQVEDFFEMTSSPV
jgi:hypothetical protein